VLPLLPLAFLQAQQPTTPGQDAKPKQESQSTAPIDAAVEPTDPLERALRDTRNRLQNSHIPQPVTAPGQNNASASVKRNRNDGRPSGPPSVVFVDQSPPAPNSRPEDAQLPVPTSDTIVLGAVIKVQPYLSEDGTALYTEFTVSVEEVLKQGNGLSLKRDSAVTLYRMGGSLRLASGKVLQTDVHGLGDPPAAGHRYVCFLRYVSRGSWFSIVKLWELRNALAVPLDEVDQSLAQQGRSMYAGMAEVTFLALIREAVERAANGR